VFFSAALQGDDHGVGIAEDAANPGSGHEAGEAVDVLKSLAFGHPRIVTSSPRRGKATFAGESGEKGASVIESYPHDFTKSHTVF
jgi:hypothetical protein